MSPKAYASKKAFTLIELLTVIAIIGILAAIIIPVVGKVRDTARRAQCTSNIRQIATGMLMFAAENKNRFPANQAIEGASSYVWAYNLTRSKALPDRFVGWYCPVFALTDSTIAARSAQWWSTEFPRSYSICSPVYDAPNGRTGKSLSKIPDPSRTFMLTEWHSTASTLNSVACSVTGRDLLYNESTKLASTKHADGARNFAFVDGHVAYLGLAEANKKELWMEP